MLISKGCPLLPHPMTLYIKRASSSALQPVYHHLNHSRCYRLQQLCPPSNQTQHLRPLLHLQRQTAALSVVPTCPPTLAPLKPTTKISPQLRSAQIARHFSTSSSVKNNNSQSHSHSNSNSNSSTPPSPTADMTSEYKTRKVGAPNTLEHRIYIEKDGVPVSPFHDIPLYANEQQTVLNMIVEIPRWTNGKLEVCSSISPSLTPRPPRTLFANLIIFLDFQGGVSSPIFSP